MLSMKEAGLTPVLPSQRFVPLESGLSRAQILHRTGKVRRPARESFVPALLEHQMGPHFVGVILGDGKTYPVVEEKDKQLVVVNGAKLRLATFYPEAEGTNYAYRLDGMRIIGGKIIPVSTHGPDGAPADMMMNFVAEWQKFYQAPPAIRAEHLNQRANTLQALFDRGADVVYTGRITSPASWREEDPGLQTAMTFHDQGHTLPDIFNRHGAKGIREFRKNSAWDKANHEDKKSASMMICEPVAALAQKLLRDYWPTAIVETDQHGFTIQLPGYTLNDFRKADRLLVPLGEALDQRLAVAHKLVYASNFKKIERFTLREQLRGEFAMEQYKQFFTEKVKNNGSPLARTLHTLADSDELRHGFGHIFGASFNKNGGAQFEFSTAVLRSDLDGFGIGPNEMRGFRLTRDRTTVVPREKVQENAVFLRNTV